jgi:hypothetical protein
VCECVSLKAESLLLQLLLIAVIICTSSSVLSNIRDDRIANFMCVCVCMCVCMYLCIYMYVCMYIAIDIQPAAILYISKLSVLSVCLENAVSTQHFVNNMTF